MKSKHASAPEGKRRMPGPGETGQPEMRQAWFFSGFTEHEIVRKLKPGEVDFGRGVQGWRRKRESGSREHNNQS